MSRKGGGRSGFQCTFLSFVHLFALQSCLAWLGHSGRRAPNPPAALIRYHEVGGRRPGSVAHFLLFRLCCLSMCMSQLFTLASLRLEDDYELQACSSAPPIANGMQSVASGLAG